MTHQSLQEPQQTEVLKVGYRLSILFQIDIKSSTDLVEELDPGNKWFWLLFVGNSQNRRLILKAKSEQKDRKWF